MRIVALLLLAATAKDLDELTLNPDPARLPVLTQALESDDPNIRWRAAWALSRLKDQAAPAVPALALLLADDNEDVRYAATVALSHFPKHKALTDTLKNKKNPAHARTAAALALARSGEPTAVRWLERALRGGPKELRPAFADALGRCGLPAAPALIKQLRRKELHEPLIAAFIRIGPDCLHQLDDAARGKKGTKAARAAAAAAAARVRASLPAPAPPVRRISPKQLGEEYLQHSLGRENITKPPPPGKRYKPPPRSSQIESGAYAIGEHYKDADQQARIDAAAVLSTLARDLDPYIAYAAVHAIGKLKMGELLEGAIRRDGRLPRHFIGHYSAAHHARYTRGYASIDTLRTRYLAQMTEVRSAAMWACVHSGHDTGSLRKILDRAAHDDNVKAAALATLWFLGDKRPGAEAHVLATLRTRPWTWRIEEFDLGAEFLPALLAHPAAVKKLGDAALPQLRTWLTEGHRTEEVLAAIRALGETATPLAVTVLNTPLEPDVAAGVLRGMGDKAIWAANRLRTADDPRVRDRAARFLD